MAKSKNGSVELQEYRVRLNPVDVNRLREAALVETTRCGKVVFWSDLLREGIAQMAAKVTSKR
jgi:hypothetical protein